MVKFTTQEVSFLRAQVERSIKDYKKIIKGHEKYWDQYDAKDIEWASNRITHAEQRIDELFTLLSKIDTL